MQVAKDEYHIVWQSPMATDARHYNHLVEEFNLQRYGDRDVGYAESTEQESGWDMTSRFYSRSHEFLAIDLNCYLYTYEIDFAHTAHSLSNEKEHEYWQTVAKKRKQRMQLFWNKKIGFFSDYDYIHKANSDFLSLAGFVPLWAGIATKEQAATAVKKLPLFETDYGLAITSKDSLFMIPIRQAQGKQDSRIHMFPQPLQPTIKHILAPKQWDYPNIWPPLEYLTVMGLIRYGYKKDAQRIMKKSIHAHVQAFKKYGGLLEKMDGLTGDKPKAYWYPTQVGFGWTNAIFTSYISCLNSTS
jgi:alpha,alpha-trehalase